MKTIKVSKSIYLDRIQEDWLRVGLSPLTQPGEFEFNNAHEVTRVSETELIVVNTAGVKIRYIVR